MDATDVLHILRDRVPDAALDDASGVDMPTILVDREHIVEVCQVLRDDPTLQFALLVDVTAADYLPASPRYEIVYLAGVRRARRMRSASRLSRGGFG